MTPIRMSPGGIAVSGQHRLVTRSDFDGLVCAALLKELGMIDDILFVHPLMMMLIDACREKPVEDLLAMPDVQERVKLYAEHSPKFSAQLQRCARVHGNLLVLDLRNEETIYAGNRFTVYALFRDCNISMHIMWGLQRQNTVCAIGKSIVNRSSPVNVGALCLEYGGGGHANAGTCQVANHRADAVAAELIARINRVAVGGAQPQEALAG